MKKLAVILIVLSAFFVFGCMGESGKEASEANQTANKTDDVLNRSFVYEPVNTATGPVKQVVASTYGDAEEVYGTRNLRVKDCLALKERWAKTLCISKAAVYLDDSTICKQLRINADEESCYQKYAIENADAQACDYVDSRGISACKKQVAILTGNSAYCTSNSSGTELEKKQEGLCTKLANSKKLVGKEECADDYATSLLMVITPFGDAMAWLGDNHSGEKVLSWWDYGNALECVGLESVISSKNLEDPNILEVADMMVANTPEEMAKFMREHEAKYLLLDYDLIGKWGALTYLSCYRNNQTTYEEGPGRNECDTTTYMYERMFIPKNPQPNDSCETEDGEEGVFGYSPPLTNYCVSTITDSSGNVL